MKKQEKKIAVYPGTFDPLTLGHLDIIKRASLLFDEIIISVSESSSKNTLFTVKERVKIIQKVTANIRNVKVESFSGLLVNYAERAKAGVIVRGLRTVADFDFEFQMALTNKKLTGVETVFLMPSEKYTYISSTLVKEIVKNSGDVSAFVPPEAAEALKLKYRS